MIVVDRTRLIAGSWFLTSRISAARNLRPAPKIYSN